MSTPSSHDIRKYGLEFINDLAKDREVAVQSLGVAFSAMKTELRSSKILTRSAEFKYIDDLMKRFREDVNRNFESQLTRITIKSLGWLKRVMRGEQIFVSDESREEELQEIINDLSKQLKSKSTELSKLSEISPKIKVLETQVDNKDREIQELKTTKLKEIHELQQQVLQEKNRADKALLENKSLQEELFDFQLEFEERIKLNTSLEEQNTQLKSDLIAAKGEITRLTSSLDQARSAVDQTDEDVTAAMQQWAISYQQQEEYFQNTLENTKQQYEEMIKIKLQEITAQHQKELNTLNEKFYERDSREKEYQNQISEMEMDKQTLTERKDQLDLAIDELSQKYEDNQQKIIDLNRQIDKLQIELEEEKTKEPEGPSLQLRDIQLARAVSKSEWLEQCLSYSNFAPLTILLRMGNEMDIKTLAKSVGMDPIVLDNQLQVLHKRDLIDIRNDGMIVANIPSPE